MNPEHNCFFVPPENISRKYAVFPKKAAHHAAHVLRKKENETMMITDGQGNLYTGRLTRGKGSSIKVEIVEKEIVPPPVDPHVDLAFVPLKGHRTDYIVEKGKELGVRNFLPFVSHNAVVKNMGQAKIERFNHVMISAMLQSRQCFVSPVIPCTTIRDLIEQFGQYDEVLVADPSGKVSADLTGTHILLVVGPEGGFERDELSAFTRARAGLLSLGKRRLRSETAAIAGLVKIQTLLSIY